MKMTKVTLATVFSIIAANFCYYMPILLLLIIAMVIDYGTGVSASYLESNLSSRIGIKGIIKKLMYMVAVLIGFSVDFLIYYYLENFGIEINLMPIFGMLVTIWLILTEFISILENLNRIGVPLPDFLMKVVVRLKEYTENATNNSNIDSNINKKDI